MRFFWILKIFLKGVLSHIFIWAGPPTRPMISNYPVYRNDYKKQPDFLTHTLRSIRNVSLSPSLQGSITIEAAFSLPLFLFFCIQLLSLISLFQLHSVLEAALHQETAKAALRAYACERLGVEASGAVGAVLEDAALRAGVIARVGNRYLDSSMIEGGSSGIRISCAEKSGSQDVVDVVLSYRIKPVVDILGFSGFSMENRCRMKAWTGYRTAEYTGSEMTEELVYITETGTVYHKSRGCTHLTLSVRSVERDSLAVLRNESGGKYYPCEGCGGTGREVFLTDQGNRYHSSLTCSGLKRTIMTVPVSQAGGRGPCSRCCAMG